MLLCEGLKFSVPLDHKTFGQYRANNRWCPAVSLSSYSFTKNRWNSSKMSFDQRWAIKPRLRQAQQNVSCHATSYNIGIKNCGKSICAQIKGILYRNQILPYQIKHLSAERPSQLYTQKDPQL